MRWSNLTVMLALATLLTSPATPSLAAVTVNVATPQQNQLSGEIVSITVAVSSLYEIKSVVANIGGRTSQLSFSSVAVCNKYCSPGWFGTISLDGFQEGVKTLTVTATDFSEDKGSQTVTFTYDKKPTVTVTEPVYESVATPVIRIAASCADTITDCTSLKVYESNSNTVLATGTTSLNQNLSLADYNGREITLSFVGTDSKGQAVTVARNISVEASERLVKTISAPGKVWDYGEDGRVLFLDASSGTSTLKILAPNSSITNVLNLPGKIPREGYLSPHGAFYYAYDEDKYEFEGDFFEFKNGQTVTMPSAYYDLKVAGNYGMWGGNGDSNIYLRDFLAGTNSVAAVNGANAAQQPISGDLAPNGDVVFVNGFHIFDTNILRYRAGTTSRITNDLGAASGVAEWSRNFSPRTDGINVAYVKQKYRTSEGEGEYELYLHTGQEIKLSPPFSPHMGQSFEYRLNNGWTAYTKPSLTNVAQIWLRSPSGTTRQVTFFNASSSIVALSPVGDLFFSNAGKLYYYSSATGAIQVSTTIARPVYVNSAWRAVIGRSIFAINLKSDITAPHISALVIPASSNSLNVPISTFAASDNVAVTHYCVTESSSSAACAWSVVPPTSYTFSTAGSKALHAFVKDAAGNIGTASAVTLVNPSPVSVTVTVTGSGEGSVHSIPSGISCISGSCTAPFPRGAAVDLFAHPSASSNFTAWSGGPCSGQNEKCTIRIDAATSIAATFTLVPAVRIGTTAYTNIQTAYDAAKSGEIIRLKEGTLAGPLTAASNKAVTIRGGYNATYTSNTALTRLRGPIRLRAGEVIADRVKAW